MNDETRPAPDWLGDVSEGVDAWTRREPGAAQPATEAADEQPRRRSGQPRDRWGRGPGGSGGGGRSRRGRGGRGREEQRADGHLPADDKAHGQEADPESVARTILLDQLTGRARTRKELSDKLATKDVPEDVAERLLDRFEEVGLVDDDAFARTWVSQRQSGKGLARRALAQELRRKGVADDTAREVLDELDPEAEEQAARELVRRKLRSLSRLDDQTATRRLVGMLARKGYGSGMAFAVVRDELKDAGRDEPDADPDL